MKYFFSFCLGLALFYFVQNPNRAHPIAKTQTPVEEKPFVVLVLAYNNAEFVETNLRSIFSQEYNNYRVIYIDDASTIPCSSLVHKLIKEYGKETITTFIQNEKNIGAMVNHVRATHLCDDREIIVIADGDDALSTPYTLTKLNEYYADSDVWLTYGSHLEIPSHAPGRNSAPLKKKNLRKQKWSTSHLRSYYAGLAKKIPLEQFLDNGEFLSTASDVATMFPMVEIAGSHARYLPDNLYLYKTDNPISDHRSKGKEQLTFTSNLRHKLPLAPLKTLANSPLKKQTNLIVFSFDRPIQLYAFLESSKKHLKGDIQTQVLYRASHEKYEEGYQIVKASFPEVTYLKQPDENPKAAFKLMLLKALFPLGHPAYTLFAVDDIIVKKDVDLDHCISLLEKYHAYGFYLRLGKNIDYCYTDDNPSKQPHFLPLERDLCAWQFSSGTYDWDYPNSIDLTLFRSTDLSLLFKMRFTNPNELERKWKERADSQKIGLAFSRSKMVNIPMNLISETYDNRRMEELSTEKLLEVFLKGEKIDLAPIEKIKNNAPHMEINPEFCKRPCTEN